MIATTPYKRATWELWDISNQDAQEKGWQVFKLIKATGRARKANYYFAWHPLAHATPGDNFPKWGNWRILVDKQPDLAAWVLSTLAEQ